MFSFLYKYEWFFLFISETLTWIFIITSLLSRYRYRSERISNLFLCLVILCNFIQLLLVGIDYYFTGSVSFFQIVIIVFIFYASTLGINDIQRLDTYIKSKLNQRRSINIRTKDNYQDLHAYITYRRRLFLFHSITYILFHYSWYISDPLSAGIPTYHLFIFNEWIHYPHQGFFSNNAYNIISYLWKIFYSFDVILFIIYTILNRNKK